MDFLKGIQAYLIEQNAEQSLPGFVFSLLCCAVLCQGLSYYYVAFGNAISNRRSFARVFVMLGLITAVVVTVIKTSLALSLGLVGALSIIRFRGAIKEPEELAYLFAAIAIGLGCGAKQLVVTGIGVVVTLLVMLLVNRRSAVRLERTVLLSVSSAELEKVDAKSVVAILGPLCPEVHLRRLDRTPARIELVFSLPGSDFAAVDSVLQQLPSLADDVEVSVLDNEGVF